MYDCRKAHQWERQPNAVIDEKKTESASQNSSDDCFWIRYVKL